MQIIYTPEAAGKCFAWSKHAGLDEEGKGSLIEVGWLGSVRLDPGETFVIEDVFLLEQRASGGNYTADADSVAKFYSEYIMGGGDPGKILHFGHSHANMSAFQSATDKGNVKDTFNRKPYCVAVTWNAKGETYGEITMFQPWFKVFEKIPVLLGWPTDENALVELREKVTRESYSYSGRRGGYPVGGYKYSPPNAGNVEGGQNPSELGHFWSAEKGVWVVDNPRLVPSDNYMGADDPTLSNKQARKLTKAHDILDKCLNLYEDEPEGVFVKAQDGKIHQYVVYNGELVRAEETDYFSVGDVNEKRMALVCFQAQARRRLERRQMLNDMGVREADGQMNLLDGPPIAAEPREQKPRIVIRMGPDLTDCKHEREDPDTKYGRICSTCRRWLGQAPEVEAPKLITGTTDVTEEAGDVICSD